MYPDTGKEKRDACRESPEMSFFLLMQEEKKKTHQDATYKRFGHHRQSFGTQGES
jgi:hypothetical protein